MTIDAAEDPEEENISIHTALAGCDLCNGFCRYIILIISIHTALAGCDSLKRTVGVSLYISIHTALAGCDKAVMPFLDVEKLFQSTQPSQAVTLTSNTLI